MPAQTLEQAVVEVIRANSDKSPEYLARLILHNIEAHARLTQAEIDALRTLWYDLSPPAKKLYPE